MANAETSFIEGDSVFEQPGESGGDARNSSNASSIQGLSNSEALSLLRYHLKKDVLEWHRDDTVGPASTRAGPWRRLREYCREQQLYGCSFGFLFLSMLLLAVGAGTVQHYQVAVIVQAVVVVVLTILSIVHSSLSYRWKNTEVLNKVTSFLDWVKGITTVAESSYPGLSNAGSSSVKLNVVVRGQRRLLLPTAVLVPGDVIAMLPEQIVPCACVVLSSKPQRMYLDAGNKVPWCEWSIESDHSPTPVYLQVQECMAVHSLRKVLAQDSLRPSPLEQQVSTIAFFLGRFLVPIVFVLSLLMQTIFWLALSGSGSDNAGRDWSLSILVIPVHSILPLLPITFPWMWETIVMYFTASMLLPIYQLRLPSNIAGDRCSWQHSVVLWLKLCLGEAPEYLARSTHVLFNMGRITTLCCMDKVGVLSLPNATPSHVFFFMPIEREHESGDASGGLHTSPPPAQDRVHDQSHALRTNEHMLESPQAISTGPSGADLPSSNVIMSTSNRSMTLDQLSPNDLVEARRRCGSLPANLSTAGDVGGTAAPLLCSTPVADDVVQPPGLPKILELTYSVENERLEFHDQSCVDVHKDSLTPLGLNVIFNHGDTVEDRVADDASLTALLTDLTSSQLAGKACVCKFAWEVGFDPNTLQYYQTQRRIVATATREAPSLPTAPTAMFRSASVLSSTLTPPTQHLSSTLVATGNTLQLMTEGSGDLVLEACTDYFTGTDICPLNAEQRKSIQDFNACHSSQSHCVAFSYRPLPKQMYSCARKRNKTTFMHLSNNQMLAPQMGDALSAYSVATTASGSFFDEPSSESSSSCPPTVAAYQRVLSEQIFMGMLALRYLPKDDVVKLVEDAKAGGIRFVHFSTESEPKSRLFAERLGIETGWNCHISLKPRQPDTTSSRTSRNTSRLSSATFSSAPSSLLPSPSQQGVGGAAAAAATGGCDVIEEEASVVAALHDGCSHSPTSAVQVMLTQIGGNGTVIEQPLMQSAEDVMTASSACGTRASSGCGLGSNTGECRESVDSGEVDFNETARLPRGIDEIRPHLDNVDNVPLQVPLFTDCEPEAICEMMQIMQERGEVVCCMGSSLDFHNTPAFARADVGVAIEPELPSGTCSAKPAGDDGDSDWLQLATRLCSMPCSIVFHRNDPIRLITLVGQARSSMHTIGQYFLFLCGCYVSISLLLLIANLFFLPPPLSGIHVLWLITLVLPLVASGILGAPSDPKRMSMMPSRATDYKLSVVRLFCHYTVRMFPLAIIALICFGVTMTSFCKHDARDDAGVTCHPLLGATNQNSTDNVPWNYSLSRIALAQDICALILVFFFGVVSVTFFQRTLPVRSYLRRTSWKCFAAIAASFVLQVLYSVVSASIWFTSVDDAAQLLGSIQVSVWLMFLLVPFLMVLVNELIKKSEHKILCKEQRSAKLIFETKLGMNSPI
eukprot:scpid26029/ scgid2991/ Uncharacterized protein KIAA0195; Transmembrane protein 94